MYRTVHPTARLAMAFAPSTVSWPGPARARTAARSAFGSWRGVWRYPVLLNMVHAGTRAADEKHRAHPSASPHLIKYKSSLSDKFHVTAKLAVTHAPSWPLDAQRRADHTRSMIHTQDARHDKDQTSILVSRDETSEPADRTRQDRHMAQPNQTSKLPRGHGPASAACACTHSSTHTKRRSSRTACPRWWGSQHLLR